MFIVTASRALELELDERCVRGPEAAAGPAGGSRALAPRGAARGERGREQLDDGTGCSGRFCRYRDKGGRSTRRCQVIAVSSLSTRVIAPPRYRTSSLTRAGRVCAPPFVRFCAGHVEMLSVYSVGQ